MRVLSWEQLIGAEVAVSEPVAMSIGVFDGGHRGHRCLIELIRGYAHDTVPAVLTFRQNPARRLRPQYYHGDVESFQQRLEKLKQLGVTTVIAAEFTTQFQQLTGEEFLDLLRACLPLRYLAIGPNFRCGREMQMTARDVRRYLENLGVRVDIAIPVVDNDIKLPVSSTVIRRAVLDGELERVRHLLGSDFEVDVADVPLQQHGSQCRVRKRDCLQVLPQTGLFEVELLGGGSTHRDTLEITENHFGWTQNCNTTDRIRFLRQLKSHE